MVLSSIILISDNFDTILSLHFLSSLSPLPFLSCLSLAFSFFHSFSFFSSLRFFSFTTPLRFLQFLLSFLETPAKLARELCFLLFSSLLSPSEVLSIFSMNQKVSFLIPKKSWMKNVFVPSISFLLPFLFTDENGWNFYVL